MSAVSVSARMILDSRGQPTLEVELELANGRHVRASVPSGASTGTYESVELRDRDPARWHGQGVERALHGIREVIAPALVGRDLTDQRSLDEALVELDGTADRSRLGANALLAASVAGARGGARERGLPLWLHLAEQTGCTPVLPLPMVNILSGNLHAGGAMDVQDVLAVPHGAPDLTTALEWVAAIYRRVGSLLREQGATTLVGDEGGYGHISGTSEHAIGIVVEAMHDEGLEPGVQVAIGLDVAGAHLTEGDRYRLDGDVLAGDELIDRLVRWCKERPICSIEDPFDEDAWELWSAFVSRTANQGLQVLGDDLIVTHRDRLDRAIDVRAANAVLVKANQIGTVTEALDVSQHAAASGFRVVVSARSGETEDDWLADVAVASGAGQIKVGSLARSERLAKYNRLLRIGEQAHELPYAGGGSSLPYPLPARGSPPSIRPRQTQL